MLIPKTLVAVAAGVIALQMASSATQAQNPGPRTGFILGRTIDAGTGQPVAGAVVTISIPNAATGGGGGRGQTAGSPTFADPAAFPQRAITNSAGYFLFRELPAGRFSIATNAMGYLNGGYLQNKPNGVVRPMDLGEGEKRADVQIKLWKYGAISGTVLDEAGEPAVGATVRLMRRGGMGSRLLTSAGTELTDDRGAYRFGNLLPGDYVAGFIPTPSAMPATLADSYLETRTADPTRYQALMAEARTNGVASLSNTGVRLGDLILEVSGTSRLGYTPPPPRDDGRMLSYATTLFQNAPTAAEAATITIGSGEERAGVDLSIKLVPTARVSGTLTGPDGPARNMGLQLIPTSGRGLFIDDYLIAAALSATDQNGAFTFLGVPAGSYILKSSRVPTFIRAGPITPGSPDARMLFVAEPLTVESTDLTGVNVRLRPAPIISGRVEFIGKKPPPAGQAMQGINASLVSATSGASQRSSTAIVAADGTFATNGDVPGRYFVFALPPSGWTVRAVTFNGRNIANESLELAASDLADVVITFVDTVASLSGTITDAKGTADALLDVVVFPADWDGWRRGEFNGFRARLIAATTAGAFNLAAVPAGQYYVVAVDAAATSQWSDPRFLDRLIPGATKVTIAEGEQKTVALKTFAIR